MFDFQFVTARSILNSLKLRQTMSVSVCMATYNGAKYINEQISSILLQLSSTDELIIVDDCSKDSTVELIQNFKDDRIVLYKNSTNKGVNFSFEKALSLSSKEYIFMSDQDDVWIKDRLNEMKNSIAHSNCLLLSSNSEFIDGDGKSINFPILGLISTNSHRNLFNIYKVFTGNGDYFGCAMVFKQELKSIILPIPFYVESHDLWIAKAANLMFANLHIDTKTLKRRVHGSNASIIKRNIYVKIWSRFIFLISIFTLIFRILKYFFIKK